MMPELPFPDPRLADIPLALGPWVLALWLTSARRDRAAVIGFTAYGLLVAIAWVRLGAMDVALTEAALGSGLMGLVLALALIVLWSLGADRAWEGRPRALRVDRPSPALVLLARLLPPLGVMVGVHLFWTGADHPGGPFQAGAVLTFSAVPMVCLKGGAEQLAAAFRYLLFALLGSALYLLGTGLMLGLHGNLDIAQIAAALGSGRDAGTAGVGPGGTEAVRWASLAAVALMSTGLVAKTALMPLHLWLPAAHAGAPAPASAVLSALVVKGSFFLLFRLWLDLVPRVAVPGVGLLLGALGVFAIVLGNLLALMQDRLKLLVAYSTLAQLGYLFLLFPLASGPSGGVGSTAALVQVVSHALAKGALFLLALCALLLGFLPPALFSLLDVGREGMASAAAVDDAMRGALTAGGFWGSAGPVLAVALAVVVLHGAGESSWGRGARPHSGGAWRGSMALCGSGGSRVLCCC